MYVVLYRFPMDTMHISFFSGIRFTPHRLDLMSFLHLLLQHGVGIAQWINARMMRPSNHAINLALLCPQGKHVAILVGVGFLPSFLFNCLRIYSHHHEVCALLGYLGSHAYPY